MFSAPLFIEWHVQFTTVPFGPLHDLMINVEKNCPFSSLKVFNSDNFFTQKSAINVNKEGKIYLIYS